MRDKQKQELSQAERIKNGTLANPRVDFAAFWRGWPPRCDKCTRKNCYAPKCECLCHTMTAGAQ